MPLFVILLMGAATAVLLVLWLQRMFTQKEDALRKRIESIATENVARAQAAARQQPATMGISALLSRVLGARYARTQADMLAGADVAFRVGEFISLRICLAAIGMAGGLVLIEQMLAALVLAILGYLMPALYVRMRRNRRRVNFDIQLPDTLQLITNSLRSGFSFNKSIEVAGQSAVPPMSHELAVVLREITLGMSPDDALHNMARRVQSPDFDIVVSAYLIQREVGGNLAVVMEKVADTVRQRLRLRGEMKVLTAQGVFSGWIVGLLPVAVFGVLCVASPGYFDPLVTDPMGIKLLAFAVTFQIIGVLAIKKIVSIKF
ncbi:MAG: type II secretion system F family protein [Verrucomicrobia bacterium]|nr:type II secretion system F family protein [Verrucomicrobiota bacterium]